MTETFYVLECEVSGIEAEFYLNDVPIIRRTPTGGAYYGGPVNQYLVPGPNVLMMVVRPGPRPSEAQSGANGVKTTFAPTTEKASARVRTYPRGAVVGGPDGHTLMEVEWPIRDERRNRDDFQPMEYPLRVVQHRDLGPMYGQWSWQSAPKLKLDAATVEEIRAWLEKLRGSLAAGDPEPYIRLQAARLRDVSTAYDTSPQNKANQIRQVTREDAAKPWWGFPPLDPRTFDLRLCGGERMVQCVDREWNAILRENVDDEGGRAYYPMMLSKLNGDWHIVR